MYRLLAAVRQLLSMPPQIRGHMVSTSMCLCTTTTYSLQLLIFGVIHMVSAFLFSPPSPLPPVTHRDKQQNSKFEYHVPLCPAMYMNFISNINIQIVLRLGDRVVSLL